MDLDDRDSHFRNALANERTFLAYLRTALAFFAAGVGLVGLFSARRYTWTGCALIVVGAVIFFVGAVRFAGARRSLQK